MFGHMVKIPGLFFPFPLWCWLGSSSLWSLSLFSWSSKMMTMAVDRPINNGGCMLGLRTDFCTFSIEEAAISWRPVFKIVTKLAKRIRHICPAQGSLLFRPFCATHVAFTRREIYFDTLVAEAKKMHLCSVACKSGHFLEENCIRTQANHREAHSTLAMVLIDGVQFLQKKSSFRGAVKS